jgi:hypothetical protein
LIEASSLNKKKDYFKVLSCVKNVIFVADPQWEDVSSAAGASAILMKEQMVTVTNVSQLQQPLTPNSQTPDLPTLTYTNIQKTQIIVESSILKIIQYFKDIFLSPIS